MIKTDTLPTDTLKSGGIGCMPTDTIFGLVGSALSEAVVSRIYKVRGRNPKKPLIILISSPDDLGFFDIRISANVRSDLNSIWPGPVSVILPVSKHLLSKWQYLHRGTGYLAFRVPKNVRLRGFLKNTGPLVAPSANPQSLTPAKNVTQAKKYFGDRVDFYIAGRSSDKPSTMIKFQKNGKWEIVREGAVSANRLRRAGLLE